MWGIDSGNLMCASIMLENDSYILILLGYWGYEQWNQILRFLELIKFVIIVSIILRISDTLNFIISVILLL